MSSRLESTIWSCNTSQRIPCFDSCQLIITWTWGNGATLLFFKVWELAYGRTDGRTYVRTDSHVTTKIFEIDGLPNFLRYGAPLVRLRRAGAPLIIIALLMCHLLKVRENPLLI